MNPPTFLSQLAAAPTWTDLRKRPVLDPSLIMSRGLSAASRHDHGAAGGGTAHAHSARGRELLPRESFVAMQGRTLLAFVCRFIVYTGAVLCMMTACCSC